MFSDVAQELNVDSVPSDSRSGTSFLEFGGPVGNPRSSYVYLHHQTKPHMKDVFELGTTVPHEEACSQVGTPNYSELGLMEARVLISQLRRIHGPEPTATRIRTIRCQHDFGTYHDVAVEYDDDSTESVDYMLKIESGIPDSWDEQAREELSTQGYFRMMEESQSVAI